MGIFSKFEGKMEDTLEGAADRMFDSPISPVQIAKKAEKQMKREKMVGAGKQYAPTLYTILVNPDDDQHLFGYYPTLAGETETYLTSKAADEGLVMDGQPLVRFIVDEGLKHGKFDVIAEAVAAPIIAQLRNEEMQRYGLAPAAAPFGAAGGPLYGQAAPQPYGNQPAVPGYGAGAYNQPALDPYAQPVNEYYPNEEGYDEFGATRNDYADNNKPALPYVPEDELDYSIDYGEYTFDSQNFEDYRNNGPAQGKPIASPSAPSVPFGAGAGAAAGAAGMGAAAGGRMAADTVVFAAGAAGAGSVPNQAAIRARLIDTATNRTYTLATARLLMGRESNNDIAVNDINASRIHAELRLEPQGVWTITDLGSTNGTLVNDAEIATVPLYEGDRITIGMTTYVFTLS